jgi:hypothetical protein
MREFWEIGSIKCFGQPRIVCHLVLSISIMRVFGSPLWFNRVIIGSLEELLAQIADYEGLCKIFFRQS